MCVLLVLFVLLVLIVVDTETLQYVLKLIVAPDMKKYNFFYMSKDWSKTTLLQKGA